MKSLIRNTNVFLLLGVFCVNVFLPFALFVSVEIVRMDQREFIEKNYLESSALREICFSESEFQKYHVDEASDLEYGGAMYDIHSITKKDGRYLVKVVSDERETDLKKVQSASEKDRHSKAAMSFLSALFFEKTRGTSFTRSCSIFNFQPTTTPLNFVNVGMIPGPPPDLKA